MRFYRQKWLEKPMNTALSANAPEDLIVKGLTLVFIGLGFLPHFYIRAPSKIGLHMKLVTKAGKKMDTHL
jgi:hypothetical protein